MTFRRVSQEFSFNLVSPVLVASAPVTLCSGFYNSSVTFQLE